MRKRRVRVAPLAVHFPDPQQRQALVEIARKEGRSISNIVQKFIREGMARMNSEAATN